MNIEISKERMLEMAKKLASMDFCPEQKVFYKNILRMVKADAEGRRWCAGAMEGREQWIRIIRIVAVYAVRNTVPPPFAEALVRANLPEMCGRRLETMQELYGVI